MSVPERDELIEVSGLGRLDFARTISRSLTHKRSIENVYVTSMHRTSDTTFLCGAYLPHANTYLNDMQFHEKDVMLKVVEIGRQIGTAVCHEFMGVDEDNAFILNEVCLEVLPDWSETDWSASDLLVSELTVTRSEYGEEGHLRSIRADAVNRVGGRVVCRGYSDWSIQPRARYRRMRDLARSRFLRKVELTPPGASKNSIRISARSPLPGAVLEDDLWIGGNARVFVALLKVDQCNRFFFDHPNDHVPGMLMFEGMRQLALDIAGRMSRAGNEQPEITQVAVSFSAFAEVDQAVEIVAHLLEFDGADGPFRMRLESRQLGKVVTEAFFTID